MPKTRPESAMKVGDRIELTTDIHGLLTTSHRRGDQGVIRKTAPWGGLHLLRMDDGRTQFARPNEMKYVPARTGPEFAKRHGNDSADWQPADMEAAQTLAALDLYAAWKHNHPQTTAPAA